MSHYIVISGWTVLVGKSGQTVDKAGWEIVVELSYVQSDQGSRAQAYLFSLLAQWQVTGLIH